MARVRAGAEVDPSPRLAFTVASIMAKSIKVASKRRGRPSTGGRDPGIHVRLPEDMLATVDAWSASKAINRSEAIRRLVELGLKVKAPAKPVSKPARSALATELAAKD
jgi:Arc/MetJ-type ribon-helix-helix transcriptional regulator